MKNHTDPVCGMELDEKDAAGLDEYNGKTYYFDSEDCMKLFHDEPKKYV
ncbi:MAG: YHS domain-containing protein, partial [Pyrinomonadaceae bacterium]